MPVCSKPLYAAYSISGTGARHLYYYCRDKSHSSVNIKESIVNKAFNEAIESLQIVPEVMEVVNKYSKNTLEVKQKEAVTNLRRSQKILDDIKAERVRLSKRLDNGIISEATFKASEAELEGREVVADVALHEDTIDYYDLITQLRMLFNFGSKITRYWEIASFDQRREILADMFTNCPKIENGKLTNLEISPLYKAFKDFSDEYVLSNRSGGTSYERIDSLFEIVWENISELETGWKFLKEFSYF